MPEVSNTLPARPMGGVIRCRSPNAGCWGVSPRKIKSEGGPSRPTVLGGAVGVSMENRENLIPGQPRLTELSRAWLPYAGLWFDSTEVAGQAGGERVRA